MYMKFENKELSVYTSDIDKCYTCVNASQCPLIGALNWESVTLLSEELNITSCGMYESGNEYDLTGLQNRINGIKKQSLFIRIINKIRGI